MQPFPGSPLQPDQDQTALRLAMLQSNGSLRGMVATALQPVTKALGNLTAASNAMVLPLATAAAQPIQTARLAIGDITNDATLSAVNALAESQVRFTSLGGQLLSQISARLAQIQGHIANIPITMITPAQWENVLAKLAPNGPPQDPYIKVDLPNAPGTFFTVKNPAFDPSLSAQTNPALQFIPQSATPPLGPPASQPTMSVEEPPGSGVYVNEPNPAYVAAQAAASAALAQAAFPSPQYAQGTPGTAAAAPAFVVAGQGMATVPAQCTNDPGAVAAVAEYNAAVAAHNLSPSGGGWNESTSNIGTNLSQPGMLSAPGIYFICNVGGVGLLPFVNGLHTITVPPSVSVGTLAAGTVIQWKGPFQCSPPPPPPPIVATWPGSPPPPLPSPTPSPPLPTPTCPPGSPSPTPLPTSPVGLLNPITLPNWQNPNVCQQLGTDVVIPENTTNVWLSVALGLRNEQGLATSPAWLTTISQQTGTAATVTSSIAHALIDAVRGAVDVIGEEVLNSTAGMECSVTRTFPPLILSSLMGFASKWLGIDFGTIQVAVDQWINWTCPQRIPSAGEALDLFVSQLIDEPTFNCWIRANGLVYDDYRKLVDVRRSKLDAFQSVMAWRKGIFDTPALLNSLNLNGWNQIDDLYNLVSITEQIPPVGDLIRFMVREVYDVGYTAQFDTNAEFQTKFNGQVEEWAKNQGLTLEHVKAEWRAHWDLPSTGQVLEMYQRLRPGVVDDDVKVTEQDVDSVLAANDILPFWRKRLKAVAFNPLTRVDARRAFSIRSIDTTQLFNAFRDQGYNDANAQILVDFTTKLRDIADIKTYSGQTISKVLKQYRDGGRDPQETKDILISLGATDQIANMSLTFADDDHRADIRAKQVELIHKRFTHYEFDAPTCGAMLQQIGIALNRANDLVQLWTQEKLYRSKAASASMLCKWLKQGLIAADEFNLRMLRVGYSQTDATGIVSSCQLAIAEQAAKAAAAQLAKEQAKQDKAAKDTQKAIDQQIKVGKQLTKEQQVAADKQQKSIEKSQKDAQRAAEKAAKAAEAAAAKAAKEAAKHDVEPTEAMVARWLGAGLIGITQATAMLFELGYQQEDIDIMIAEQAEKAQAKGSQLVP